MDWGRRSIFLSGAGGGGGMEEEEDCGVGTALLLVAMVVLLLGWVVVLVVVGFLTSFILFGCDHADVVDGVLDFLSDVVVVVGDGG